MTSYIMGYYQGREQRQQLRERMRSLREQQALIDPTRREMEAVFQRRQALLPQQMAARGMLGGTIQTQYQGSLESARELARQRLQHQENEIDRAIRQARRARRMQRLGVYQQYGQTTLGAVSLGLSMGQAGQQQPQQPNAYTAPSTYGGGGGSMVAGGYGWGV